MSEKIVILQKTSDYVQQTLAHDSSGHDWWHIYRVWNLAKKIQRREKQGNLFIIELASLLHDIADWKFTDGDEKVGPEKAKTWLLSQGLDNKVIDQVIEIMQTLSYKGAGVQTPMKTIEGQIVQDADRLDAMGAVGIARAFAYGGFKGRPMYDPNVKPELHRTSDTYKKNNSSSINHFYEKLLLLKDRMNTETAKKMAKKRHNEMVHFLEVFFAEWEGQK